MNARTSVALLFAIAASACRTDVTLIPGSSPRQLTAVSGTYGVTLFWEDVPGASGYRVYSGRKLDGTTVLPPVGPDDYEERGGNATDAPFAKLEGLEYPTIDGGDQYAQASFTVVALRGNGVSPPSEEVLGWPQERYYGRIPVWTVQSSGTSFGVAMSGIGDVNDDGFEDVAIGAPSAGVDAGAVYFYEGSPRGLVQSGVFLGAPGDEAGRAIAVSDSWNNGRMSVFVGAPGNDSVYVVDPAAAAAAPVLSTLTPLTSGSGSRFGTTVVEAGNLDGDLVPFRNEIAIGAPSFAGGGAVFVYRGLEENVQDIPPPAPSVVLCLDAAGDAIRTAAGLECAGSNESFGAALAAAGNLENDPWDDLVIGSPRYADDGAVCLYPGSSTLTTGLSLSLVESPGGIDDEASEFGAAVASVGDADGDGLDEIAAGAPGYDDESNSLFDKGRIVVFPGVPTTPLDGAQFVEGTEDDSRFGGSLLFVRNFTDAPYGLLVGSPRETMVISSNGGTVSTPVRVVHGYTVAGDVLVPPIHAPGEPGSTEEGALVAPVGVGAADVDGDGFPDLLVSDSASGTVQLFISIPGTGPEVHAGPLYETRVGERFTLSLATFIDPQASRHRCHIDWELTDEPPLPELPNPDAAFDENCSVESLRTGLDDGVEQDDLVYEYGSAGEYVVRVTVSAQDGRRGQALTRVIVRPP